MIIKDIISIALFLAPTALLAGVLIILTPTGGELRMAATALFAHAADAILSLTKPALRIHKTTARDMIRKENLQRMVEFSYRPMEEPKDKEEEKKKKMSIPHNNSNIGTY